jgi:hypothetical protein
MRSWYYAVLGLIVMLQGVPSFSQDDTLHFSMFPGKRIFPLLTADGTAHGMSINRVTDNREWIGAIGGAVPLAQAELGGKVVQVGAAVTTFNRIIKTPGHITVYTIDYKVDFPLDLRLQSMAFRVAFGHVSCHFVDDGIEILHQHSVSYVRDYLTFAASVNIPLIRGFVYGGADWNYHYEPIADPWIVQIGAEGANVNLADWARFYAAFDVKFRQNLAWGTTQSYQAGIRFSIKHDYALRLAYTFRTGFEERGQFFGQKETLHLAGLFIDF